jgi:hypothetical protein
VNVNQRDLEELLLSLISKIYLYGVSRRNMTVSKRRLLELKLTV